MIKSIPDEFGKGVLLKSETQELFVPTGELLLTAESLINAYQMITGSIPLFKIEKPEDP